jgi:hypothetical protein
VTHLGEPGKDIFLLPVKQCFAPPPQRSMRGIDEYFLKKLKENMRDDPYGHGGSPAAVLCMQVATMDQFQLTKKDSYRFEHESLKKKHIIHEKMLFQLQV